MIYLIGSLRNPEIPKIGNKLREIGFEVFDDWYAPGPKADEYWQAYENGKGSTYKQALRGLAGKHIFEFDVAHLSRADIAILVLPAGKFGHLELGWAAGKGKWTYVLFDKEPERYDIMYQFVNDIFFSREEMYKYIYNEHLVKKYPFITY
mgnify:FL=1